MKNKNKIGALVILGGIALLGYVYFKREKPIVAQIQSQDLQKLSDSYGSGDKAQEDTKINVTYDVPPVTNKFGSSPFVSLDFSNVNIPEFVWTKEGFDNIVKAGNPAGLNLVEIAKLIKQ